MKFLPRKLVSINQSGFILPSLIAAIVAFSIIIVAVAQVVAANFSLVNTNNASQRAFNIAEAGVNYYLWHLSHNPTDYRDGLTTPVTPDVTYGYGPYVHTYVDETAEVAGTYTLWIKPQGGGSTLVNVRSIGTDQKTGATRTVEAQIGAPSFASYGLVADAALWFGNTESAHGPVHSNVGIRMDGSSDSDVTSANATYVPPGSLGGDGASHPGVWCSSSVTTPVNCNTRSKSDWRYPVPAVDFNQVSSALCTIKKLAFSSVASTASLASQANACSQVPTTRTVSYLPQRSSSGTYNSTRGYLVQLNSNGTYDLYNVNGENETQSSYSTALTLQSIATGISPVSAGVIFAEDNVWVRTNPNFTGRLTISSGRLATSSNARIVIADDIVYSSKSGSDAIGLIAEGNVTIAPYAPPQTGAFTFEVDAAILSQSGNVNFPSTYAGSSSCTRGWINANQVFNFYGSVATRQQWTWTWLQGGGSCGNAVYDSSESSYVSGVKNNTTDYDYNLLYSPPPSYPITSSYNILSWREVITNP